MTFVALKKAPAPGTKVMYRDHTGKEHYGTTVDKNNSRPNQVWAIWDSRPDRARYAIITPSRPVYKEVIDKTTILDTYTVD